MDFFHKPVFLKEAVNFLNIKPAGIYIDATAGGGGHSSAILERLRENGKLISLDQDPDAITFLRGRFKNCKKSFVIKENFVNINKVLDTLGVLAVDGFLFDLGVSSYQLDEAQRGFSYSKDALLDMRMSKEGYSAKDFINYAEEKEISRILREYGEEKYAFNIARNLVKARAKKPVETTLELVEIIKNSIPQRDLKKKGHPARRVFQAIRIHINSELDALEDGIGSAFKRLSSGGRIVVITFHSLEDRIVKKKFASLCRGCVCPAYFPVCTCNKKPQAILVNKKALIPTAAEIKENPRCKSAKLRACEKL